VLLHLRLVQHALVDLFAAQEHVADDVEVLAQRQVLVDDLDAVPRGAGRCVDGDRLPFEEHLAGVVGLRTRKSFDQG
jgi:hypothetical protein